MIISKRIVGYIIALLSCSTNIIQQPEAFSVLTTNTKIGGTPLLTSSSLLTNNNNNNNRNRIQRTQLNEENDNNNNNNGSDSDQDVNNLFATYMAQRKDKGFMDQRYNLNLGNGSGNVGSNTNASTSSNSGSNADITMNEDENQRRRLSSIPGVKRFWGGSNNNDSEKGIVQHIPLREPEPEKPDGGKESQSPASNRNNSSSTKPPNPPSLLEQDIIQINTQYEQFQTQIQNQLNEIQQQQQQQHGTSTSDSNDTNDNSSSIQNVQTMFNQIIEEQKMHDVDELKQQHALESFDEYEKRMKKLMEEKMLDMTAGVEGNLSGISGVGDVAANDQKPQMRDPIVQEIVEEVAKERQLRDKQEEQLRQYQEYEASMKKKIMQNMNINVNVNANSSSSTTTASGTVSSSTTATSNQGNFDQMQLDILQDLLQKRQQRSSQSDVDDEDLYTTDNIEDGIDELQNKILMEEVDGGGKKKYAPESLKEWQMYRAIATKLANSKLSSGADDGNTVSEQSASKLSEEELNKILLGGAGGDAITEEDADVVEQKIQAWKEFQRKEEEMRKKSGLAINYRPPFEWSDKPSPTDDNGSGSTSLEQDRSRKRKKPFDREKAEEARSELDVLALKVMNDLMNKTTDAQRREKIRSDIEALKVGIKSRKESMKNEQFTYKQKEVKPIDINLALGRANKSTSTRMEKSIRKASPQTLESSSSIESPHVDLEKDSRENAFQDDDDDFEGGEYLVDAISTDEKERPPDSQFFRDLEEDLEVETTKNKYVGTSVFQNEAIDDEGVEINLGTMEEQKFRSMVARSGVRTKEEQGRLKQEWEEFQRAEQMMRDKVGLSGNAESATAQSKTETKYDVNNIFKDGDIDADLILGTLGKRPSRKNRDKKAAITKSKSDQGRPLNMEESQLQTIKKNSVEVNKENVPEIDTSKETFDESKEKIDMVTAESKDSSRSNTTEKASSSQERGSLTFGQEFDPQKQFLSNTFSSFEARKSDLLEYSVLSVAQLNTLMGLKRSVYSTGISPYLARVNKPFQEFGAIFMLEGALVDTTGLQFEAWKRTACTYDFKVPTMEDVKYASVHSEAYAVQKIFYWTDDIFALRKVVETFEEKRLEVFQEWIESKKAAPDTEHSSSPQMDTCDSNLGDDIETDVVNIQLTAWKKAARDHGFQEPTMDLVNIVGSLNPDEAVRAVFRWTNDFMISNNIAASYRKYLKEETSTWMNQKTKTPLVVESNQVDPTSIRENEQKVNVSTPSPSMEDYLQLKLRAWENVAQKHNFSPPDLKQVNVAEFAGPEKAVSSIFQWTNEEEEYKEIISSYRGALKVLTQEWMEKIDKQSIEFLSASLTGEEMSSIPLLVPRTGVEHWLSSIADVFVPSIVISNMNEELMGGILEETGLAKYFPSDKRISASDKYETDSQKMLGGALRAERRPDHCVVFSATPQSAWYAHDLDMKNIAIVSPYPYYELTTADMTVRDFKSIGMMNLKNVFSETPSEEPMQQVQVESPRIRRETLLKTRFWDDG